MIKQRIDIVDFHSHILPCADHGSTSLEMSIAQLRHAAKRGMTRVLATPHFYPMNDSVDSFLARRRDSFTLLSSALDSSLPEVKVGAEVMICNGIDRLPDIEKLFIGGTRAILMELPLNDDFQLEYADAVYRLTSDDVTVILAHPERYSASSVECMLDSGAVLQCNASAIVNLARYRRAYRWIENGSVVALGSDIHCNDASAYNNFVKAIDKLGKYSEYIKVNTDFIWDCM